MNRRGFLQAILAAGVAPYVSTMAGVLMPGRAIAPAPMDHIIDAVRYAFYNQGSGKSEMAMWLQALRGTSPSKIHFATESPERRSYMEKRYTEIYNAVLQETK